MNEYETSYRSLDSDSLEIQDEEFNKTIAHFRASGRKIKEMKYGGGDCWGKFVQIVMGSDTVTIDKYDCGDYGFGNSQFIVHNDSLTKIREFRMEWSPDGNGYAFNVMEQILEFDPDHLTTKNRVGSTEGWEDFRFLGTPFEILRTNGATEYLRLKNELREMVLREKLEP